MAAANLTPTTRDRSVAGDVRDDLGAAIAVPSTRALIRAGADADDGSREARKRLAARLEAYLKYSGTRFNLGRSAMAVGLGVVWIVAASFSLRLMTIPGGLHFIIVIAGLIGISIFVRRRAIREKAVEIAASCVAEGFCGACAYSLRGLGADAAGLVTCPECGAAWKAVRITWAHWDHSDPWQRLDQEFMAFLSARGRRSRRTIADGFGRLMPILDSSLADLTAGALKDLGAARRSEARRVLSGIGRRTRWLMAMVCALVAPLIGLVMWLSDSLGPRDSAFWVIVLVIGVPFTLVALVVLGSDMFRLPAARAKSLLGLGLCPTCATELSHGIRSTPELAACLGCGATWTIDLVASKQVAHDKLAGSELSA